MKGRRKKAKLVVAPVETAREVLGVLEPGCRVVGVLRGQLSMLDVMVEVLEQIGPSDVWISTWTTGMRTTARIDGLIKTGSLRKVMLCIDRSYATRHPAYCRKLVEVYGDNCLRQMRTHAKFALMGNEKWNIVLRGSMNLNRNPRLEQFDLDDDSEMFEMFLGVIQEIATKMPPGLYASTSEVDTVLGSLMEGNSLRPERSSRPAVDESEDSFSALIAGVVGY